MAMPMGTATDITITIAMTGITKENTTIGIIAMMIDALLRIPRSCDPKSVGFWLLLFGQPHASRSIDPGESAQLKPLMHNPLMHNPRRASFYPEHLPICRTSAHSPAGGDNITRA